MGLSPLPFIHFWLFFFSRAKNYCKEFVLILFVYQAFEPNSIKNTGFKTYKTRAHRKKQTRKTQNNQHLSNSRFWLMFFAGFLFFFGFVFFWWILSGCFWRFCVLIAFFEKCFSFFARINFLCWSRCQTTRANEQNFVCIQPNLTRTTSNHD